MSKRLALLVLAFAACDSKPQKPAEPPNVNVQANTRVDAPRYQVAGAGDSAVMVDTQTGKTWQLVNPRDGGKSSWDELDQRRRVIVSNGNERFEIDESDLKEAEADGFHRE